MANYVHNSLIIEAVQWPGESMSAEAVLQELGMESDILYVKSYRTRDQFDFHLDVETPKGVVQAHPRDYIIKRVHDDESENYLDVETEDRFEAHYYRVG